MKVYGHDVPNILIKVFEEEEYAKSLMAGILYMKECDYFRKIEEDHRGDYWDSRIHARLENNLVRRNNIDGTIERFSDIFPGMIAYGINGIEGDNKFPIFCSTLFNENIISKNVHINGTSKTFKFKNSYINESRELGKYAVVFSASELLSKIKAKVDAKEYKEVIGDVVNYWDIHTLYKFHDIYPYVRNYRYFFNKDLKYKNQNEYRILIPDNTLIEKDKDYYKMSVGELTSAKLCPIEEFYEITI